MIPDFGSGCGFGGAHDFGVVVGAATGAAVTGTGCADAVFGRSGAATAVAVGMRFSSGSSLESSTDGAAVATRILAGGVSGAVSVRTASALGDGVFSSIRPIKSFARITPVPTASAPMTAPTAILVFVIAERCSFGMGILTMVGSEFRERGTLMITLGSCLYEGGFCMEMTFKFFGMLYHTEWFLSGQAPHQKILTVA